MSGYGQGFTPPPDDNDPQQGSPPPNDPYGQNPYGQQGGFGQNPYGNPQDPYGQMGGVPLNAQGYRSTGNIYTWQEVWRLVLTKPSEETFEEILGDPEGGMNRAIIWMSVAGVAIGIGYFLYFVLQSFLSFASFGTETDGAGFLGLTVATLICLIPFIAIGTVIGFIINTGLIHLFAKHLLKGKGDFDDLAYASAAHQAPIYVIMASTIWIPCLNFLIGMALGIYRLILDIMAIKSVYRFGWLEAIIAYFAPSLIFSFFGCCIIFFVFASLGTAINSSFDNLQTLFPTPTP